MNVRRFNFGLAQVMIGKPQICFLDEPMSGKDPPGMDMVKLANKVLKRRCDCNCQLTKFSAGSSSSYNVAAKYAKVELRAIGVELPKSKDEEADDDFGL